MSGSGSQKEADVRGSALPRRFGTCFCDASSQPPEVLGSCEVVALRGVPDLNRGKGRGGAAVGTGRSEGNEERDTHGGREHE